MEKEQILKGKIINISETNQVKDSFKKREFVVKTDEQYPQEILLQVVQERCSWLDNYSLDDDVVVKFNLRGRCSENENGKKWFNTLDVWSLVKQ